jgi:hypothetical protein
MSGSLPYYPSPPPSLLKCQADHFAGPAEVATEIRRLFDSPDEFTKRTAWWGSWDEDVEAALRSPGSDRGPSSHAEAEASRGLEAEGEVEAAGDDKGGAMPRLHARAVAEGRIPLGQRLVALWSLMENHDDNHDDNHDHDDNHNDNHDHDHDHGHHDDGGGACRGIGGGEEERRASGVLSRRRLGWGYLPVGRAGPFPLHDLDAGCKFIPNAFGLEGG